MTAKEKLENLSHSWLGYAVCSALFSVFGLRASGIISFAVGFSIWAVVNAVFLAITLGMMLFFSRKLMARSSATRSFLIVASGLFTVLGALSLASQGRMFLHYWTLGSVVQIALTGVSIAMNARSFAVLNSSKVRAYFA